MSSNSLNVVTATVKQVDDMQHFAGRFLEVTNEPDRHDWPKNYLALRMEDDQQTNLVVMPLHASWPRVASHASRMYTSPKFGG